MKGFCLISGIPWNSQCLESKKKNPLVGGCPLVPSYAEKPLLQIWQSLNLAMLLNAGCEIKPQHVPLCLGLEPSSCSPTAD